MKHILLRALRNFIVANLFAIMPLAILAIGFMPDSIIFVFESDSPCKAAIVFGDQEWPLQVTMASGGKPAEISAELPDTVAWETVKLRLECPGHVTVRSATISKGGMLRTNGGFLTFCFRDANLNKNFTSNREKDIWHIVATDNVSILSGDIKVRCSATMAITAAAIELIVLAFSLLAAFIVRGIYNTWTPKSDVFITAAVAAMFFCAILPMQSYMANRTLFDFGWGSLLAAVISRTIAVFAFLSVSLSILSICFSRRVCTAIVLATVFCGYLETGPLAFGLPSLNGATVFYIMEYNRRIWDAATLILAFTTVALLCISFRSALRWTALAISVLSLATLADIRSDEPEDDTEDIVNVFLPHGKIAQSVSYSGKGDVLVFILDALSSSGARDALEKMPELKKEFYGFTAFNRNIGMYDHTLPGVAGIATGKYLENPSRTQAYYRSIFSADSILKNSLDAGMSVFFMPGARTYGYTNRPKTATPDKTKDKKNSSVLARHVDGLQAWSLDEISLFRLAPFMVKSTVHSIISRRWETIDVDSESVMYAALSGCSVKPQSPTTFLLCHTHGLHIPVIYKSNGEKKQQQSLDYDGYVEQAQFCLKQLATLFRVYKEKGIYDNATILVLADHGSQADETFRDPKHNETQKKLPASAFPCLWIKPTGASAPFAISDAPTSHANIAKVLKSTFCKTMSIEEIEHMLSNYGKREYRQIFGNENRIWAVDAFDNVEFSKVHFSSDPTSFKPLEECRKYVLSAQSRDNVDVVFENAIASNIGWLWPEEAGEIAIIFRTPKPECAYRLKLGYVSENKTAIMAFKPDSLYQYVKYHGLRGYGEYYTIEVEGFHSDRDGVACLRTIMKQRAKGLLHFHDIEIESMNSKEQ